MRLQNKIVWSEGMFLQPQHFQQQDRYFESIISQRAHLISPWAWGISILKLDDELLALGKIAIAVCRGILPDGTVFDIPSRDKAPAPLDIASGTRDCIVYLTLPFHRAGISDMTARYHSETVELDDSNTHNGISAPVQFAQLSLGLMLETEDRAGYNCIGLLRVAEARSDNHILLDTHYIPTCLNLEASQRLMQFVHEVQGLLHYRGNRLSQRITEAGSGGVSEIADFLLLQLINRYELLFQHLQQHPQKHPQPFYELILQLIGEFSTFTQTERRPILQAEYLHHDLETAFAPLITELYRSLRMVLEESAVSITLDNQSAGLWIAAKFDRRLLKTSLFILAVHANLPTETIRQEFPVQTKISPLEEIRHLVNRALPGVPLQPLAVAPRQIPYHANHTYFALDNTHPLWQKLEQSAGLAFHVSGEFSGMHLALWAVKDKYSHE